MDINLIIMSIMAIFMAFSAIDRAVLNNRFGYGEKFDEGMYAMGPLATAMLGFMCIAPVLGNLLTPVITPVFGLLGIDSAMLAGSILSPDMGGYPLAKSMTENSQTAILSGGLYASMMGTSISFGIPVALGIIKEKDKPYFAKGIMAGVIPIPIACIVGGLVAGMSLNLILVNIIPSIILAIFLSIGLWKIPKKVMSGFIGFSKFITMIMYLSLAAAIFEELTGIVIIPGMDKITDQFEIVGICGITLAGAYPFVHFVTQVFKKPLNKFGKILGVNNITVAGLIASLANSIPMLAIVKDMDNRGKVVAIAFSVSAAFVLGDHLAYASANFTHDITALIVTKLVGGILGAAIALFMTRNTVTE